MYWVLFQAMHDAHPVDQITKACFEPDKQVKLAKNFHKKCAI
jgi:hypothetical protein